MRDRLLGGECTNQLSNFFEGSNEEIKGRKSRCPGFRILVPPLSLSHSPDLSCAGLEGQHSWVDYWFSLHTCSAA